MAGWIKLHRSIKDWEWFTDVNTSHLFIYLLLKANRELGSFQGFPLERGQLATGRKALSTKTGLSEQQIRTSLKKLQLTNNIAIKSTKRFSIITIVNYSQYQDKKEDSNQQINQQTNQQVTSDPTTNKKEEVKKEEINSQFSLTPDVEPKKKERKKKSYDDDYEKFYSAFPKKAKKAEGQKVWREHKANGKLLPLNVMLQKLKDCSDEEKWSEREKKYVPSVWTWLEQDRYLQQFAELTEDDKSMLASIGTMAAAVKAKMEMERE